MASVLFGIPLSMFRSIKWKVRPLKIPTPKSFTSIILIPYHRMCVLEYWELRSMLYCVKKDTLTSIDCSSWSFKRARLSVRGVGVSEVCRQHQVCVESFHACMCGQWMYWKACGIISCISYSYSSISFCLLIYFTDNKFISQSIPVSNGWFLYNKIRIRICWQNQFIFSKIIRLFLKHLLLEKGV